MSLTPAVLASLRAYAQEEMRRGHLNLVIETENVLAMLDDIDRLRARWAEQLRFTHEVTDASFAVACENAKLRGQLARAGAHDGGRPTA